MLCTYSINSFTNEVVADGGPYRLPAPCEAGTYELINLLSHPPAADLWTCDEMYNRFHAADVISYTYVPVPGDETLYARMISVM